MTRMRSIFVVMLMGLMSLLSAHAQTTTITYVYNDPQGTPLAEADVKGNITATFDYRPYGTQALGVAPNGPGYTGHVNDPETDLVYMQARYYDPGVGRFLSIDPITPSAGNAFNFSRYAYANNNSIKNTDPTGAVVISPAEDQKQVVSYINSLASGTFAFNKAGNLEFVSEKSSSSKGSSTYTSALKTAISSKTIMGIAISSVYKDTQSGKYVSVDEKSGGGVTQGALGGSQLVVISGNENKSLKDTSGAPLKDTAAYILAHEVVGHAVPMMTGNAKGNAVDDENKVRSEVPGSGQRQAEPDHEEGGR